MMLRPLLTPLLSLLLLLVLSLSPAAATQQDILNETCKECAARSTNVDYKFCVTALGSVNISHRADLQELGVISLELAIANATAMKKTLQKLLEDKPRDPYVKSCLETCKELYCNAIPDLEDSIKAVKARRYDDANVYISAAMDAPGTCEDSFKDEGVESPVTKENDDFFRLVAIAIVIERILEESVTTVSSF